MATFTGSGKWIQVSAGTLSFGNKSGSTNTTYGNVYANSITQNSVTYRGFYAASMSYLNLTGLTELTVGDAKGYTGIVKMYTYFYDPYNVVIWDPDWDTSQIVRRYKNYRFVHGFMVGEA